MNQLIITEGLFVYIFDKSKDIVARVRDQSNQKSVLWRLTFITLRMKMTAGQSLSDGRSTP